MLSLYLVLPQVPNNVCTHNTIEKNYKKTICQNSKVKALVDAEPVGVGEFELVLLQILLSYLCCYCSWDYPNNVCSQQ